MLNNITREIFTDQVGVPPIGGQKPLHPVRGGVAFPLRQLPAILVFHRAEQSPQIVQSPPAWLRSSEPSSNTSVYLLDPLSPPGHCNHLVPAHCQHLTSSSENGSLYIAKVQL